MNLAEIRARAEACQSCALSRTRTNVVFGGVDGRDLGSVLSEIEPLVETRRAWIYPGICGIWNLPPSKGGRSTPMAGGSTSRKNQAIGLAVFWNMSRTNFRDLPRR